MVFWRTGTKSYLKDLSISSNDPQGLMYWTTLGHNMAGLPSPGHSVALL